MKNSRNRAWETPAIFKRLKSSKSRIISDSLRTRGSFFWKCLYKRQIKFQSLYLPIPFYLLFNGVYLSWRKLSEKSLHLGSPAYYDSAIIFYQVYTLCYICKCIYIYLYNMYIHALCTLIIHTLSACIPPTSTNMYTCILSHTVCAHGLEIRWMGWPWSRLKSTT